MTKDKSTSNPKKPIKIIIRRYSLTVFIIIIAGGLVTCLLMLTSILSRPVIDSNAVDGNESTTFDQATVDRVKKLKTSDDSSNTVTLPAGKINPFTE